MIDQIRNYLNNKDYNINISNNSIYINNYNKIDKITSSTIIVNIQNIKLHITGENFKLLKMLDKEVLFNGQIKTLEIIKNDWYFNKNKISFYNH